MADVTHLAEAVGLCGFALYLGSFAALQTGLIRGNGFAYTALNGLAAAFVLISLMTAFNLTSALIQVSWLLISLYGLLRMFCMGSNEWFSDEETSLIALKFPHISGRSARRLLDAGIWSDQPTNAAIATQGIPLNALVYLHAGAAEVHLDGTHIASIRAGGFIGEMSVLCGAPASAGVTLSEPSRTFQLPTEALQRLTARDRELQRLVEISLAADVKEKLLASNRQARTIK